MRPMLARRTATFGFLIVAASALAQDAPYFYVEKECRALPTEVARTWCLREERCNEKWLADNWRAISDGSARNAVTACVTLAKTAQAYQYWTLRHCLAPSADPAGSRCE